MDDRSSGRFGRKISLFLDMTAGQQPGNKIEIEKYGHLSRQIISAAIKERVKKTTNFIIYLLLF